MILDLWFQKHSNTSRKSFCNRGYHQKELYPAIFPMQTQNWLDAYYENRKITKSDDFTIKSWVFRLKTVPKCPESL